MMQAASQKVSPHSTVYERLVDDAPDNHSQIVGLIAYGLYKAAKREWVLNYVKVNGRSPTSSQVQSYTSAQTQTVLDSFRSQGADILGDYAESVVFEARPEIEKEALRGNFWRAFYPSIAASFVFALIVALLVFVAAYSGITLPFVLTPSI